MGKVLRSGTVYMGTCQKDQRLQDTVHGECWGSGNVTTYLETENEQDKQNEEVF